MSGWVGVGFDGVLAHRQMTGDDPGAPIRVMIERVKNWLAEGRDVRIVTSRVHPACPAKERAKQKILIERWTRKYLEEVLPVTAHLEPEMIVLYDHRVVQVEKNTGRIIEDCQ